MIDSSKKVIDFDRVKEIYSSNVGKLSDTPSSNDALFLDNKNNIIFIEFKNGEIDKLKCFALKKKIYDSMLILNDITQVSISYARHNIGYILVYNDDANVKTKDNELISKRKKSISSPDFNKIVSTLAKYADSEYICFGLSVFKNYIFKEVHTYNKEEFKQYLDTLKDTLE